MTPSTPSLAYATIAGGHSVINGTAPAGYTLKVTKDFNLYTNTIRNNTTPVTFSAPQAIPTHLESWMQVPASGKFAFHVNPSVRPVPPYRAEGMVPGPSGYYQESWTLTCIGAGRHHGRRDQAGPGRQGPDEVGPVARARRAARSAAPSRRPWP